MGFLSLILLNKPEASAPALVVKGNKKIINAWAMYDWANSVYSLTITTAIFPIYFTEVTTQNGSDIVNFLGRDFNNTALYTYTLSIALLLVALLSPMLSAIADARGSKKVFMKFFSWMVGFSFDIGESIL